MSYVTISKEHYEKLVHYANLEEQLEKLYGGRLSLDNVVDNLNRIVQNGEEKLDFARILTNAEAEKWNKWKDLEEQGRLIELPCKVGNYVYDIADGTAYKTKVIQFLVHGEGVACRTVSSFPNAEHFGTRIFLTKEEAEKALAELKGE